MAALTAATLKKNSDYQKKLLEKAKNKSAKVKLVPGESPSSVSLYGATVTYKKNSIEKTVALGTLTANQFDQLLDGTGHKYNLADGSSIAMGKVHKSEEFKGEGGGEYPVKFNRGGVNEGVTGAAIFLRFINKSRKDITEAELKKFILGTPRSHGPMKKEGHQGKIWGPGDNAGLSSKQRAGWPGKEALKDDIWWEYGLKKIDAQALYDDDMWEFWKGKANPKYTNKPSGGNMITGALNFVNQKGGKNVRAWADSMYNNGVYNEVIVNAEGETGQSETKVDIRVTANNHHGVDETVDIMRISAKFGGVGQFGQMSEKNIWESTAKIMDEWFGIIPSYSKDDWRGNMITKDNMSDAAVAMREMWAKECGVTYSKETRKATNTGTNNLTAALQAKGGAKRFKDTLWKHLSQGKESKALEMGVILVDNYKGDSHIYNLDALRLDEVFDGKLSVEFLVNRATKFSSGAEDLCSMVIKMKDPDNNNKDMEILAIRVKRGDTKKEGPYYRTIFEKKKGLTKAISRGSNIDDPALDDSKLKAL